MIVSGLFAPWLCLAVARAAEPAGAGIGPFAPEVLVLPDSQVAPDVVAAPAVPDTGLHFLGLADTKLSVNNIATTSPLVNGQIVGTLGGLNATTVQAAAGSYVEQRVDGFLTYRPKLLDGKATLTAAFEVDFAWGDGSYSIGGNTGGGVGGDQVNLQTRRLETRFQLWRHTSTVVGLQFVGDGVADPENTKLDELTRSGGKLMFFGTEAAGISVYGKAFDTRASWRVGMYTLAEQALAEPDDVTLWMGDGQQRLGYATTLGAHFWYLRDRGGGTAGVLGSGPTSALSEMQGGPRLDLSAGDAAPETNAALGWGGLDFGYNAGLDKGPIGLTGLLVANFGRLYVTDETDVSVFGVLGNAEARLHYAPGAGSVLKAELIGVTGGGGEPADTGVYHGVITGNSYGIAATAWSSHGCLLLFPDPVSINRSVAAEYDVSGAGQGLFAATGQLGYDAVPNLLTVAVGGGVATHPAAGGSASGSGAVSELNLRVVGKPLPLLTVGLYGGVLLGADFDVAPWEAYTSVDWVVF